jgi:hypothetical protein
MGGGEGEAAGAAVEAGAGVSAAAAPAGHRCRLDGGPPAGHHAPAGHPWRLDRDASDGVVGQCGQGVAGGDWTLATPVTPAGAASEGPATDSREEYGSPEKKFLNVPSACQLIITACDYLIREPLERLGTAPSCLEAQVSSSSNLQLPDDQFFEALAEVYNDPDFTGDLLWTDAHFSVGRESVLFIGTQFSNLYTTVDTPAKGRMGDR